MQRKEEAHEGGQEASRFHGNPPRKRGDQGQGKSESTQDVSPGRGDQFFNIAIRDHFTEAEIIDFTGGEIEEIGDASAVLKMCEKLLPVVRNLPQWKEHKWDECTTVGQILSHISDTVKLWNTGVWDSYMPVNAITYGDPRIDYRRDKSKEEKNPSVWVVWAYQTSQQAIMPSVSFLPELKKKSPTLYNILCTILGRLNKDVGIHLWSYLADVAEDQANNMADDWPNDNPDPEFLDEVNDAQSDINEYWEGAGPTLKHTKKMAKTSMVKLRRMISRYKWDTPFKKKIKAWVESAILVIESKKNIHEFGIENVAWMQRDDWSLHPHHYIWFRWFGENEGNYVENEIDQILENSYNEGGFYPFRRLLKYSSDEEFQKIKDDQHPFDLEKMMINARDLFTRDFMKKFNR